MGEGEEKRKKKKKKRRRGRGDQEKRYGTLDFCMETNLDYGFYEIMYEFPCLVG